MKYHQSGKTVGRLRNFDHYLIDAGAFIIINIDPNLTDNEIEYTQKSCESFLTSLSFNWDVTYFD